MKVPTVSDRVRGILFGLILFVVLPLAGIGAYALWASLADASSHERDCGTAENLPSDLRDLITTWRMRGANGPADELEETLSHSVCP